MDLKGGWIVGGFVIGVAVIIQSFRPAVDSRKEACKIATVMCDSVFFDEKNNIIFAVRNKSGEQFYIDEAAAQGLDVIAMNKQCKLNVLSIEYVEGWSILNINGNNHRLSRVHCNDKLIWTKL